MKLSKIIVFILSIILFSNCNKKKTKVSVDALKNSITNEFKMMKGDFAYAFINLSNPNEAIEINSNEKFHAASTMKVPVMIQLFKDISNGKFNLTDSIIVKNEFKSIVDESSYKLDIDVDSGEELYNKIGKKVILFDLVYDMITVSSNLATNILVELADAKRTTFSMKKLGANNMIVLRGVEDLKAYKKGLSNSTTAKDLLIIMKSIADGSAGKNSDCNQMIEILKEQKFNDMIPKYYPENIVTAHKTGSISGVHHDAAIVYLPNGRSFVLVILSKNLEDFDKATDAMARIAEETLHFMQQ